MASSRRFELPTYRLGKTRVHLKFQIAFDFLKIPFVIKKTFVILKSEILGTD